VISRSSTWKDIWISRRPGNFKRPRWTCSKTRKVVFNFSKLRFVGSSGISHFIKVLKKLNAAPAKPKLCNLSSEFLKMFKAYQTARNPFLIFDDELTAMASFSSDELMPTGRRRKPLSN
jgi:hypothetical protein